MNFNRLFVLTMSLVISATTCAQNTPPADDPMFITSKGNPVRTKVPKNNIITPNYLKSLTVTGTVAPCDGGVATLAASGACSYSWSTDSLGTNVISSTSDLVTGTLLNDTTFYLTTADQNMTNELPLPTQSSTYSTNVRGYYFIAPIDFVITGLRVPTEANSGAQNIAVTRFDNQTPPPLWSSTTNAFTTLGYWNNYTATDTIPVCIPVYAGDVIGIYGNRNDINSYGTNPYTSSIGGIPITLNRSGMQLPLSSNPMQNIFAENSGSISRVQMFYDDNLTVTEVNVTVPFSYSSSVDTSICAGDSLFAAGTYQTSTGIYTDNLQTVYGCDSTLVTNLTVNELPIVTMETDSLCSYVGVVTLNGGSPSGGIYSGTGVSGNDFDASIGPGAYPVSYAYTDSNGCSNTAVADITVLDCASITENQLEEVSVYPNPVSASVSIVIPEELNDVIVLLYDNKGKIIDSWELNSGLFEINTNNLSKGSYIIDIQSNKLSKKHKIIKQ